MAQDTTITAELVNANQLAGGVYPKTGGTGATLAISGTIATAGGRITKVTPTSAVTACIAAAGITDGQELTIMNLGAAAGSSITFATAGSAAGSSNLATDFVISGLTCAKFVWETISATWFPVVN